jgi:phenylpropionate dioxygenase-like ring-hydroxylating dioxygenase large terminal subunit
MLDPTRFFHPVLAARELGRAPARVLLADRPYVLFRDHEGVAGALRDACPHRLAPLSQGVVRPDGRLACPYHGWHFDRDGRGISPSQPTLKSCDAQAMQVVERHGYLWLADRAADPAQLPEFSAGEGEGYEFAGTFSTLFAAPLHVALDNFSEDEHTPWVHTRLGWRAEDVAAIEFHASNHPDRTEVAYAAPQRPSLLTRPLLLRSGDIFHNRWQTRFDPVRTIYAIYWTSPDGATRRPIAIRATVYMVPETARTTRFHTFLTLRLGDRRLQRVTRALQKLAIFLARREFADDARFIRHVADTPESMAGMRLGKFDKPLIHNHRLLRTLYWGEPGAT